MSNLLPRARLPLAFGNLYSAACTHALLGEIDRSIDLLEICLRQFGNDMTQWIKNNSDLDPVRGNTRYQALFDLSG